jgi:hypothetical protein
MRNDDHDGRWIQRNRASSGVGKSDAVKTLYKPLKMTATLKRRARKKVKQQKAT